MLKKHDDDINSVTGYKNSAYEWIHILFVAIVIAGVLNCFFGIINVRQESMMPTVQDGDKVCLNRAAYWFGKPKSGDIIIFYEPNANLSYVKRVIGIPGDTVEIKNGMVYVNQNLIDEPYVEFRSSENMHIVVPEGKYFCLGDNRATSVDSRDESIGCISDDQILGKVSFSLSKFQKIN